mmetsp:Transcript_58263/g.148026  ORF Transcript_58263/g.148026 Transcript_58263/m.148026 type:complete len:369 (+) Transcript_58263:61-1167(+)
MLSYSRLEQDLRESESLLPVYGLRVHSANAGALPIAAGITSLRFRDGHLIGSERLVVRLRRNKACRLEEMDDQKETARQDICQSEVPMHGLRTTWPFPRREDCAAMHQAARGTQSSDEGPEGGLAEAMVDDIDRHRSPVDRRQQIAAAQRPEPLQRRGQLPGGLAMRGDRASRRDVCAVRRDEALGADGRREVSGRFVRPVERAWHQGHEEGRPVPRGGDLQSFDVHGDADEHDNGVQDLRREDREDRSREPRTADDDGAEPAGEGVTDLGAHGLEGAVADVHRHPPRRSEEAGDDCGQAVPEHRPLEIVVVSCIFGHLSHLDRPNGHGQSQRDHDAHVRHHRPELFEGRQVGCHHVKPYLVHGRRHI